MSPIRALATAVGRNTRWRSLRESLTPREPSPRSCRQLRPTHDVSASCRQSEAATQAYRQVVHIHDALAWTELITQIRGAGRGPSELWRAGKDSNPRPSVPKTDALSPELPARARPKIRMAAGGRHRKANTRPDPCPRAAHPKIPRLVEVAPLVDARRDCLRIRSHPPLPTARPAASPTLRRCRKSAATGLWSMSASLSWR